MKKPTPEELDEEMKKLTVEKLDTMIKVCEESIKEMEEALQHNIEYPSNKQKCELCLVDIKDKKGRFFNLLRRYGMYKLKKSANKPPKKLDKDSREFLEEMIWRQKRTVTILKKYKKHKTK